MAIEVIKFLLEVENVYRRINVSSSSTIDLMLSKEVSGYKNAYSFDF
jgi:hypothetical protein